MATSITVNGKTIKRPGVYALTQSGIKYPPQNLSYGNIVIIDNGLGAGFVGGAGVDGEATQGVDSVYEINTIQQYRAFTKGGPLWDLGEALFKPSKNNYPGVSKVFFVKAATTTSAEIAFTFTNGSITFETLDEGLGANGVLTTGALTRGYACKLLPSNVDPTKFSIKFYNGVFSGLDPLNNLPYDGIAESDVTENIFLSSPDVLTVQELVDWCLSSNEFKSAMRLKAGYTATGAIVTADVTANPGFKLATGGTESYTNPKFDDALMAVKDTDNTFFLSLDMGADATSLENTKIVDFLNNESKYEKFLIVAGGYDKGEFATNNVGTSEYTAKYFDSDRVIVVHGGTKKNARKGTLIKSQLYKAAKVLGRTCGLPPQTPITFKDIDVDGEVHKLSDYEKEYALDKGILTTHFDNELGYHVIQQGITSLQRNTYLVNEDGTSHDIAVKRITAQLNKEIVVTAKKVFFGKNSGPNRNTMSEDDVKAWLEGFLQKKMASTLQDNLIIRFGDIQVAVDGDNYFVSYSFVPNYPVSKIVFTGIILEK